MIECKKCLFNSDNYPKIKLDEEGVCDICHINSSRINNLKHTKSDNYLKQQLSVIKSSKREKYDCLIGISGGTDSTYLVYLARLWGLKPLLLHIDGGWNSEISVINIENIVKNSGFDFLSNILPWKEMQDVQKSFIDANVLDIDIPFDNAMLRYCYSTASKYKIKYIINGYSTETEGVMPDNFAHFKYDRRNISDIHKKFGKRKLKKLKFLGTLNFLYFDRIKKIKMLSPLDWIDYNKVESKKIIAENFQWKDYGGKHYENVFTRFYQGYILPKKFKIDKRISHISMLICSGQINKSEAKLMLENLPLYPNKMLERDDKKFFLKKLKIQENDFDLYMESSPKSHRDYKSDLDMYDALRPIYRFFKKTFGLNIFRN